MQTDHRKERRLGLTAGKEETRCRTWGDTAVFGRGTPVYHAVVHRPSLHKGQTSSYG